MPGTPDGIRKGWIVRKARQSGEYTMRKGDTLRQVSQMLGVDLQKLKEKNAITSKEQIKTGLVLQLPE